MTSVKCLWERNSFFLLSSQQRNKKKKQATNNIAITNVVCIYAVVRGKNRLTKKLFFDL